MELQLQRKYLGTVSKTLKKCRLNHTAQIENVKSTPSPGTSDYLSLNEVAPLWAEIGIDYRLSVSPLSATTLRGTNPKFLDFSQFDPYFHLVK